MKCTKKIRFAHLIALPIIAGLCAVSPVGGGVDPLPCVTDLDGDGETGFTDLVRVLNNWGTCKQCKEDFNGDAEIGFADLVRVLTQWGPCG